MPLAWDFGDGTIRLGVESETHTYQHAVGSPFAVRVTEDETGATGWVPADPPLAVPSRVIPWAELGLATGTNAFDLSYDSGHGTGVLIMVVLAYNDDPPQGALTEWVPAGTVKLDVLCSDPAWPRPSMLPLLTADLQGQRVFFGFNDDTLGLQAGAPKDVQFHLIGLDGSDVEIWRKSAPFHVDLVAADTEAAVEPEAEAFDPDDYTVAEVIAYVEANPDETQAVYDAESAGKARTTLLADLEGRLA